MEILHIVILSLIEGITEFLPISSTAHLILTSHVLQIPKTDFLSTFEISIQLGAIAAVVAIYWKRLLHNHTLFYKAIIGFIPTGLIGFTIYRYIKPLLNDPFIPVVSLFLGGIVIILIEKYFQLKMRQLPTTIKRAQNIPDQELVHITYRQSLLIGLIQSVSMIPGVSRAAASIFGGMAIGLNRKTATEFAFLLAIPTMALATGYDLFKSSDSISQQQLLQIGLGIAGSFLTALFVIRWLINYVQTNNFIWFGIYRIVLSIAYYLVFLR